MGATDGPVLNLIKKRLRSLRKKLNRITRMEDSISQGKTLNKEQEEVFRTKPSVISAIDELEKLKQPLSVAVADESDLAVREVAAGKSGEGLSVVEKLLELVYFGSMFDVRSEDEFTRSVLTKTHERNCCLSELLAERDLDLISKVGSLLVSRPVDTSLSHKNALEKCVERAKLWIESADQPIDGESNVTYSLLKEKLAKIMASPYFREYQQKRSEESEEYDNVNKSHDDESDDEPKAFVIGPLEDDDDDDEPKNYDFRFDISSPMVFPPFDFHPCPPSQPHARESDDSDDEMEDGEEYDYSDALYKRGLTLEYTPLHQNF